MRSNNAGIHARAAAGVMFWFNGSSFCREQEHDRSLHDAPSTGPVQSHKDVIPKMRPFLSVRSAWDPRHGPGGPSSAGVTVASQGTLQLTQTLSPTGMVGVGW